MGDPVEKVMDVGKDVFESDIGKAAALATAAYFGAPYLAGAEAGTGAAVYGGLDAGAIAAASETGTLAGAGALSGVAAIEAAAPGAFTMGLTEAEIGSSVFAPSLFSKGTFETIKNVATILSPTASIASSLTGAAAAKKAGRITPLSPTLAPEFRPSPIINQAMRGSIEQQVRRRGRTATILTDVAGEKLGS